MSIETQIIQVSHRDDSYFKKMMVISSIVPTDMIPVFGKCNFIYRGEYNCQCWGFTHKDMDFLIVSANNRGTSIEADVNINDIAGHNIDKSKVDIIVDFVNQFYDKISAIDSPKIKRWIEFNKK